MLLRPGSRHDAAECGRGPASIAASPAPSSGLHRTHLGEPGLLLQVPLVGSAVRRVHVGKGVGLALAFTLGWLGLILLLKLQLPVELLVPVLAVHPAPLTGPRAPALLPPLRPAPAGGGSARSQPRASRDPRPRCTTPETLHPPPQLQPAPCLYPEL